MRVGIRGRFTLWFGGTALVTIAATAWLSWRIVSDRYRREFDATFHAAGETATREIDLMESTVTRSLDGLASRDAPMIDEVLFDLQKNGGVLSPDRAAELQRAAAAMQAVLGLASLELTLPDDTVIAAPHWTGRVGARDPRPRQLALAKPGEPALGRTKVERSGKLAQLTVIEAARSVSDGEREVTVLLGYEIGADLLARLERQGVVEARLTDATGNQLVATEASWAGLDDEPATDYALRDASGEVAAHLWVVVPDDALHETLRQLARNTALLGALALVLAIALGVAISRRMTRDLDRVVVAAQAVARGDLGHTLRIRARDEIGDVAVAFNAMTRELRDSKERLLHAERVAAWQDIARSLAHELKNPLTPIQMSVETMRKSYELRHASFDEIFQESSRTILEEVERLKKIVGEFSQFARLPAPKRQPCDVNEIAGSALSLYRGSVKVVRELGDHLPRLEVDRDQLTQVVLNLLENARDAVAARGSDESVGRITVRTRAAAGAITLEVEDNGPGIDPAIRDKLFTPYFTTKDTGTGLGLAIAHRIVAEHGGKLSAGGEPGKGALFVVELPAPGA